MKLVILKLDHPISQLHLFQIPEPLLKLDRLSIPSIVHIDKHETAGLCHVDRDGVERVLRGVETGDRVELRGFGEGAGGVVRPTVVFAAENEGRAALFLRKI
jgi:hypothetical protein